MKHIAKITAAIALTAAAGVAGAASQISTDDFSALTGPTAHRMQMGGMDGDRAYRDARIQASPTVQIQGNRAAQPGVVGPNMPRSQPQY